jgi:hypothetical protein
MDLKALCRLVINHLFFYFVSFESRPRPDATRNDVDVIVVVPLLDTQVPRVPRLDRNGRRVQLHDVHRVQPQVSLVLWAGHELAALPQRNALLAHDVRVRRFAFLGTGACNE